MATDTTPETLAELIEQLGKVPLDRVRCRPAPGTATEQDVLVARAGARRRLCELADGTLVEKAMGTRESLLAGLILHYLWAYLDEHDLGTALGADGMVRLMPGLVRIPDVSFIRWEQLPGGQLPDEPVASVAPDLVVEVLSPGNTPAEMRRKLKEYFLAGTRLVWIIDPVRQTAVVHTGPDVSKRVGKTGSLDGGAVLPGFVLALPALFARAQPRRKSS